MRPLVLNRKLKNNRIIIVWQADYWYHTTQLISSSKWWQDVWKREDKFKFIKLRLRAKRYICLQSKINYHAPKYVLRQVLQHFLKLALLDWNKYHVSLLLHSLRIASVFPSFLPWYSKKKLKVLDLAVLDLEKSFKFQVFSCFGDFFQAGLLIYKGNKKLTTVLIIRDARCTNIWCRILLCWTYIHLNEKQKFCLS